MKQSIFLSLVILLLVLTLSPFGGMGDEVEIISNGQSIYVGDMKDKQVIWIVDEKVYRNDEIYEEFGISRDLDLYEPEQLDLSFLKKGEINMLLIDNGVKMYEANCKDKICVKMGKISNAGQSIVCAPHKLVVKINGKSDIDG